MVLTFPQPPPSPHPVRTECHWGKRARLGFFLRWIFGKWADSFEHKCYELQLPSHKAFSWSSCSSQLCLIQRFGCSYFMMLHSLETHCSPSPLPADVGSCASSILLLFLENFFSSSRCLGKQCGSNASCPSSRQRSFRKIHWPFWATQDVFRSTDERQTGARRTQALCKHISIMDPEVQHPPRPHIPLPYKHNLPAMLHQAMFLQWVLWCIADIIKIFSIKQAVFVSSHLEALDFVLESPLMSPRNAGLLSPLSVFQIWLSNEQ